MAVTVFKTFSADEVLTASDLNSSLTQFTDNGEDFGTPWTKAHDADGNEFILDSDADSSLTASTDDRLDLRLAGVDLFRWLGTVTSPVNGLDWVASATGNAVQVQAVGSDTNITINIVPKGTGMLQVNGVDLPTPRALGNARRLAGVALFKAQTTRAMVADITGNLPLITQVSS